MNYLGLSSGFHDAAVSLIDDTGNILFAGHSERYTKEKHTKHLCRAIVEDALSYATSGDIKVHYYERPWMKFLRQVRSGEKPALSNLFVKELIGQELIDRLQGRKVHTHNHHLSHAAAGFQTSPYDDATVVVIDAIGEFDTITIYNAYYDKNGIAKYKKLWGQRYPDSIGLFYSAMTKRVGLKPLDEEYILMGMAAYGNTKPLKEMSNSLIESFKDITFKDNLQIGVPDNFLEGVDDIIAIKQHLIDEALQGNIEFTKVTSNKDFNVSLPTTFNLYADVHLISKLNLTLFTQQKLNSNSGNNQIAAQTIYSVTPRFGIGFFEAYLPLSTNDVSGTNAGLGFRLGGFFMGSNSILSAMSSNSKQVDLNFGFRFAIL